MGSLGTWAARSIMCLPALAVSCSDRSPPGESSAPLATRRTSFASAPRAPGQRVSPAVRLAARGQRAKAAAATDLASVMRRAPYVFRDRGQGLEAGGSTWRASAAARGIEVAPAVPDGQARAALSISTSRIARGAEAAWEGVPMSVWQVSAEGALEAARGPVLERIGGDERGAEQSWSWREPPAGTGDLVVALAVEGMRFEAATSGGLHFIDDRTGARLRYGRATWIDAEERALDVMPVWEGGKIVLTVPGSVIDESVFPAVLDPTIGPELALDAPVMAPRPGADADVAWDGTNFLVVWGDGGTYAVRVSPAGAVLDASALFVSSGGNPSVAYGGGNYMIADDYVRVQRVSRAGALVGSSTTIDTAGSYPDLAYGGSTFLVTYFDSLADRMKARGVTTTGVPLAGEFDLSSTDCSACETSSVAFSPGEGDFLVAFEGIGAVGRGIRGQRVTTAGVLSGTDFAIEGSYTYGHPSVQCGATNCLVAYDTTTRVYARTVLGTSATASVTVESSATAPAVTWDGTDFLVAYDDGDRIAVERLTTAGASTGTQLILPGTNADAPAIGYGSGRSLVAWLHDPDWAHVVAARVSKSSWTVEDAPPIQMAGSANAEDTAAVASDGTDYLVAWSDTRDYATLGYEVYGARVTGAGAVLDAPALRLSDDPVADQANEWPGIAFGASSYFVGFKYGSRLVPPSGAPAPSTATCSGSFGCAVAFDLTRYLMVYTTPSGTCSARLVSTAGTQQGSTITIATGLGSSPEADVTFDGLNFVVAYDDGTDVWVKRVNGAGVILDPSGVNVTAAGSGTAYDPAIGSDRAGSYLTWRDSRSGSGDIYASRLSQGGVVLDPSGVNLSSNSAGEQDPDVAWDGTGYVVVWTRGTSGADLVGAWVKSDGAVLDPGGLVLSSDANSDLEPAIAGRGAGDSLVVYHRLSGATGSDRVQARTLNAGGVLGASCATGSVCASRLCTDSTCCSAAACGTCQSCAGGGACAPVLGVDDPDTCTGTSTCSLAGFCKLKDGQPCVGGATACASGYCADGVCCNQACTGACQACTAAKKGSGADGACAPVDSGTDPDDECASAPASGCAQDGTCNGSGACRLWPVGTSCGATTCSGGQQTGYACNGSGTCLAGSTSPCSPYVCADASVCATACAVDGGCVSSHWCDGAACQPALSTGAACDRGRQCQTGQCVDGVCCDTVCNGLCQACSAAKKGGGTDGACGGIAGGSDPDAECAAQSQSTCGTTGSCSGVGTCALHPSGTTCGAASCASGVQTGYSCNGAGSCQPGSTTPCFPYVCASASACASTCSSDSQCDGAYYCRSSDSSCQPKLPAASACSRGGECQSGSCADGVCCDTGCAGICVACTAALKGTGADGVCGPVPAGSDLGNDCAPEAQSTCGRDGSCNGAGACAFYAPNTPCGTTCSGAVVTDSTCNGAGQCSASSTTPCSPYLCASGSTCRSSCASDGDCVAAAWCRTSDSTCQDDLADGAACTAGGRCQSGHCVDGVCCDSACDAPCQACAAAQKSGGTDGACGPAAAGKDPHNDCADDGATSCDRDGQCDGAGACRLYSAGTSCGSTACVGNAVTGRICNGLGDCGDDPSGTDCAPYLCVGSACANPCATDGNCQSGNFCDAGTCRPRRALGETCTRVGECQSGSCADSVCCDTACTGVCMACSAAAKGAGSDGACGPVGGGADPDGDCAAAAATTCGQTGACDGAGACALWSSGTACGTTCTGATLTGLTCNGSGACAAGSTSSCSPYLCGTSTSCATACAQNTDCVSAGWCRTSDGTCQADLPVGGACTTAAQCLSGHCVDGVCCDTACNGLCQACAATLKTAGTDGVCGDAAGGQDPHNDCPQEAASSCARDGECDGSGACRLYSSGTACGATSCVGNAVKGRVCNGLGTCTDEAGGVDCAPYRCVGSACTSPCGADTDCLSGNFCAAGACLAKRALGEACGAASECQSGSCADGVCCDTACTGTCVACTAALKGAGADGACEPVAVGTDPGAECAPESPASCGRSGACDGAGSCSLWAANTPCATSCSAGAATASSCNGIGQCVASAPVSCAPYGCAAGTSCASSCAGEGDCAASAWCRTSDATCQPDQALGEACTAGAQCTSGNCVDGVCCDTACDGLCQACTGALKTGGGDGSCGDARDGYDPHDDCAVEATSTCGRDGQCDGAGACRLHGSGVACGATTCTGGTVRGAICNGAGQCTNDPVGTACTPYVCSGSACSNPCATESDCVSGYFCDQGTCRTKLGNGEACFVPQACQSGNCADGVCCDTACTGPCVACSVARKGTGVDGACESIAAGSDPDNECSATSTTSCGDDGACDGAGGCRKHPAGTACGAAQCVSNRVVGEVCDGFGSCGTSSAGIDCSPFACVAGSCPATCTPAGAECLPDFWCDAGTCRAKGLDGSACAAGRECSTGFCVDGVCCNAACTGQCEACDLAGNEGTCGAVTGGPHGGRAACAGTAPACAGTCDGNNRAACTFPASGTACGTPSCAAGTASASACDGAGACQEQPDVVCSPFACDATSCKIRCDADADCAAGFRCDAGTGECVPSTGKCVENGTVAEDADGNQTPCAPYFCAQGACRDSCDTTSDCAAGYVCNTGQGQGVCDVVRREATAAEDSGCGCRLPGRSERRGGRSELPMALVALAALARRRRWARS